MRVTSDKPDEMAARAKRRRATFLGLFAFFVVFALLATVFVGTQAARELPEPDWEGIAERTRASGVLEFPLAPDVPAEVLALVSEQAGTTSVGEAGALLHRAFHPRAMGLFYVTPTPGATTDWALVFGIRKPQRVYMEEVARIVEAIGESPDAVDYLYYRVANDHVVIGNRQERVDQVHAAMMGTRGKATASASDFRLRWRGPWIFAPGGLHASLRKVAGTPALADNSSAVTDYRVSSDGSSIAVDATFSDAEDFAQTLEVLDKLLPDGSGVHQLEEAPKAHVRLEFRKRGSDEWTLTDATIE